MIFLLRNKYLKYVSTWSLIRFSRLLYILFYSNPSSRPLNIKQYKLGKSTVTRNIEGLCTLYNRHVIYFTQLEWRFNSFLRSLRNWNHRVSVESFQHTGYTTLFTQNIRVAHITGLLEVYITPYIYSCSTVLSPLSYACLVYKWRTKNLRARRRLLYACCKNLSDNEYNVDAYYERRILHSL